MTIFPNPSKTSSIVSIKDDDINQIVESVTNIKYRYSEGGQPTEVEADFITTQPDVWRLDENNAIAYASPAWKVPFYSNISVDQPKEGVQFNLSRGAFVGLANDVFHEGWWNMAAAWFAAGSTTFFASSREEFNLVKVTGRNLTFRILVGENNTFIWQSRVGSSEEWRTHYSKNHAFLGTLFVYGTGAISGASVSNIIIEKL